MSAVLMMLYVTVVVLAAIVARLNRDRPITLALTAVPALSAIYAAATRTYRLLTGERDAVAVYDAVGTLLFWLALAAILAYAILLSVRIARGRSFVGPDGRRWAVRRARLPGAGVVKIARRHDPQRPAHLIE